MMTRHFACKAGVLRWVKLCGQIDLYGPSQAAPLPIAIAIYRSHRKTITCQKYDAG